MVWNKARKITVTVGAAAALAVTGGGMAIASATSSAPSSSGVFYGCVATSNGDLRVIARSAHCTGKETRVHWNETGQRGPAGAKGATGKTGPQGAPGATGEQGPRGKTGKQGAQGVQGAPGAPGVQGVPGVQGQTGAAGIGVSAIGIESSNPVTIDNNEETVATLTIDVPAGAGHLVLTGTGTLELSSSDSFAADCYFTVDGVSPGQASPITTVTPSTLDEPLQILNLAPVSSGSHTVDLVCGRQSGDDSASVYNATETAVATQ